jgi:predicted amino acid dehydrogenase
MVSLARIKKDYSGMAVWRWSRKNLAGLNATSYSAISALAKKIGSEINISRMIVPKELLSRLEKNKLDLESVTLTDLRAAVRPRAIFAGNVLDLTYLQKVKRGGLQVFANILGGFLRLKFPRRGEAKYDYAFMVHPREYSDVLSGVPFLKILPESWNRAIVKRLPPFKLSDMTGMKDINGRPLKGALMCIGWDRAMFESDVRGREEKIADLVKLAKNLGIKYVGFAALLPWASRYGQCLDGTISRAEVESLFEGQQLSWEKLASLFENPQELNLRPKALAVIQGEIKQMVRDQKIIKQFIRLVKWANRVGAELKETTITTGHPFTVAIIASFVNKILELHPKREPLVAIVGAAGSTGSCCCKKLAENGTKNFMLVDRVKSTGVTSLEELAQEIKSVNNEAQITQTTDLQDLVEADIIVVVSSAKGTIIESKFLKPGAIVVDDSQPRNVDPKIARERPDIRIVTVLAPLEGLIPNFYFDRHTPHTGACFTCDGDVFLRASTFTQVSATGPAQMAGVRLVEEMATMVRSQIGINPLEPVLFTYDRRVIPYEEITRIANQTIS